MFIPTPFEDMKTISAYMKKNKHTQGFIALITVVTLSTYISLLLVPLFVRIDLVYQGIQRTDRGISNYFLNQSATFDKLLEEAHDN
jgi:hypothetical protein